MVELRIKREYLELLPKHKPDEYDELVELIKTEGIRDPIVHNADGVIMDGMTRWQIAQDLKIDAADIPTKQLAWDDEEHEMLWIRANQLGRRNLSQQDQSYLRGKQYNAAKKIDPISEDGELVERPTATTLAEDNDVSPRTIRRDGVMAEMVDKLPVNVKKQHLNNECKLSKKQITMLVEHPMIGQIERAIRVGNADTTAEAFEQITGKPLKKGKKEPAADLKASVVAAAVGDEESKEEEEVPVEDRMKKANSAIETACRQVQSLFDEYMVTLKATNPWVDWQGRSGSARQGIVSGLKTLRACKGAKTCPKCQGDGCKTCIWTGWVDKGLADQLT